MSHAPRFVDDHLLRIGNVEFHCEHPIGHVPEGRLPVDKPRRLVEDYIEVCRRLQPKRIVELGVYKGGSTAMLSELAAPTKLVALELSTRPVPVLAGYIEARGLHRVIRPYCGVDQADRARLAEIMRDECAGSPIDLVIDDASHRYEESLSSFETLFPLVRPGGLYLLEDWRWQHQYADAMTSAPSLPEPVRQAIAQRVADVAEGRVRPDVPLSRLVLELVLARASGGGALTDVRVGPDWVAVRRGDDSLDAGTFRVADLFDDHFELLRPNA